MNSTEASELLERAAASVTPAETDPAARMVELGRRSVRRRRAWMAGGSAAAAVAAVVAVPLALAPPDGADPATVRFGGLSVEVPEGWRTSRLPTFNPCTAEPRTVYLAAKWEAGSPIPDPRASSLPGPSSRSDTPPRMKLPPCQSDAKDWMAVVDEGVGRPAASPERLVAKDGNLLVVQELDLRMRTSAWTYRAFNEESNATTVFLSGNEQGRERLLERVTWPAGPSAPPSGRLKLPDRINYAVSDVPPSNGMRVATDTKTLNQIMAALGELDDPVTAGEECTLQAPGSVGILIGDGDGKTADSSATVVLGDATCPQAISDAGGRVRVPAGLGKQLQDLVVAGELSDD
ncbi:hypothetical protein AB0M20_16645 [Actinoplanes sp. NPDC051633]|uniref:hypothetical protein n=1 Tax=Actinoplanes sp. NPDC051633 TaxID=3155670 RepID=UPI003437F13A